MAAPRGATGRGGPSAQGVNSRAIATSLKDELISLTDAQSAKSATVGSILSEICARTDEVLHEPVGASPKDPTAFMLAQVDILEARAGAIKHLAETSRNASVARYAQLLEELYAHIRDNAGKPALEIASAPRVIEIGTELTAIEVELRADRCKRG